jgi:hypothetical protein
VNWLNQVDFESIPEASTWSPIGLPVRACLKWMPTPWLSDDQLSTLVIQSRGSLACDIKQCDRRRLTTSIACRQDALYEIDFRRYISGASFSWGWQIDVPPLIQKWRIRLQVNPQTQPSQARINLRLATSNRPPFHLYF